MMTPEDLKAHIESLRALGITGPVKIGDFEITIPPAEAAPLSDEQKKQTARSMKADYDKWLFACTEGIPDEEAAS